jgi:hypothetical protein
LKCDSVNMLKKFFENVNRQTAPLTLVLSRRGREEMKKYPLTLALSHVVEREEKEGKDFKSPLTLPSPAEWRGEKKEERGTKKNLLN